MPNKLIDLNDLAIFKEEEDLILATKQDVTNKTTSLSSSSTDTQYPSAKATYDADLVAKYHLDAFDTVSGNVITRQTGYLKLDGSENWEITTNAYFYVNDINLLTRTSVGDDSDFILNQNFDKVAFSAINNTTSGVNQIAFLYDTGGEILKRICIKKSDLAATSANLAAFQQYLSANPIFLQYKLPTAYTEQVLADLPLDTLDQTGSQFVRDEWEKTLNLLTGEEYTDRWNNTGLVFTCPETGVYTVNVGQTVSIIHFDIPDEGTITTVNNGSVASAYLEAGNRYGIWVNNNNSWSDAVTLKNQIIVVKGDHAYPYQPYAGPIVHKTDLDSGLATKQNILVSGTNIKTINDNPILGSGNLALYTVATIADIDSMFNMTVLEGTLDANTLNVNYSVNEHTLII